MSNDIKNILVRLHELEEKITPMGVKSGLNAQQKSVHQLPALFKPKNISVLSNKTDPDHPAKNYFVGAESMDLPEGSVEEDVLNRVKKGLTDYLKNIEDQIQSDGDLKDKTKDVRELQKPGNRKDRDILPKLSQNFIGTLSNSDSSNPVKSFTFEDGRICEIHGDETQGFRIRYANRELPSRFNNLSDAELAMHLYQSIKKDSSQDNENLDYIDEA